MKKGSRRESQRDFIENLLGWGLSHSWPVGAAVAALALLAGHPGGLQSTSRALALELHLFLLAQRTKARHLDDTLKKEEGVK